MVLSLIDESAIFIKANLYGVDLSYADICPILI